MTSTIRVVIYASAMAAAAAAATPSRAELPNADLLGTALLVEAPPAAASASGGSSAPGAARTMPAVLADGSTPDRVMVISQGGGFPWINVDHGDGVLFIVRQPGAAERLVEWRFNGVRDVIAYTDIDPGAQFARTIKIYVNQSTNPMSGGNP